MWKRTSKFISWRPATTSMAGGLIHLRAITVILAAVVLGLFFNIRVHMSVPILLLYILTTLCAWYGGTAVGLTALIASLPAVYFFSFDPLHTTRPTYPDDLLEVALFVALSLFTLAIIAKLRRAQARADHALVDLAAREEQYRTIVETASEGIWMLDLDFRTVYANARMAAMLGTTAEAMRGRPVYDFNFEEDHSALDSRLQRYLQGPAERVVARYRRLDDGAELWARINVGPVHDETGRVIGLLGMFRDFTEQQRIEEHLRQSEKEISRLAAIVESSEDAIIGKSLDGTITSWNDGAQRIYGWSAAEMIGRSITVMVPPDRQAELEQIMERLKTGHPIKHFETERLRQDGRRVPVSVTISPIKDAKGQVIGASAIARDITQLVRTQQQLRDQADRLAQADRRKDEFLAMLAHELRNPLAPIRYAVQLLGMAAVSTPAQQRQLTVIDRQVSHMARLLEDLLDVARITSGKIRLRREHLDLRLVADRAVETLMPQVQERHHTLDYQRAAEPLWVDGDATRLEQVLRNLITNAIKYTEPGGRIVVSAEHWEGDFLTSGMAALRVCDNGIGISPEMRTRIFELFAQAEQSLDRSQGGLGIGLTLALRLVEMHDGCIQIASEGEGQGSEFTVKLPLAKPADAPPPREEQPATPADAPPPREEQPATPVRPLQPACSDGMAGLRVLIVDDNLDATAALAELLKIWGCLIQEAHDGAAGLELALTEPLPDVVLLDIGLPKMDGYEVAHRLRQDPRTREMLVVALTGYGQEEDRMRARLAGFDRHFTKPVGVSELAALLGRIAEESPVEQSEKK